MDKPPKYDPTDFEPLDTGITLTPGDTVRVLRELNEMSQTQLAELSGIAQTTLSAIESGRTRLGAERSKMLARVFNVHPAVILFSDWKQDAA